jgi:hypothetical protein
MTDMPLALNDVAELLGQYAQGLPQVVCNCIHMFGPGIYIRQVHMPAGATIVGHWHKTSHLNILLQGRLTLLNDDGSRVSLAAPMICVANPGRKVAYIHEDAVWLNLHATNETDVETLEAEYLDIHPAFAELQRGFFVERIEDQADFDTFLWENDISYAQILAISEDASDQTPFPFGSYKFKTGHSCIEGKGLIATCDIAAGEVIAPARIDGKRTPAERYANHAKHPNAEIREEQSGTLFLVALKDIAGSLGGQDGDEITVNYRDAMKFNRRIGRIQ